MALSTHQNQSTGLHDLYITLDVYRRTGLGWTAVGIGSGMAQSLDFIVYGDPKTTDPVLSVRRSDGHWMPSPFEAINKGKIQVELVTSAWHSDSSARMLFICYSCDSGLDPDLGPLVSLSSQPWIWAKNDNQLLSDYSEEVSLDMHAFGSGYGSFSIDMVQTITDTAFWPKIEPGSRAGSTERKDSSTSFEKLGQPSIKVASHGFSMALAVSLLPCGAFAILSGHPKAFLYHWVIQLTAAGSISLGLVLGFLLRPRLETTHQKIGVATVVAIATQAVFGVCHHIMFRRVGRTWVTYVHRYLGRLTMVAGYGSAATGLVLHRAPISQFVILGFIVAAEVGWFIRLKMAHGSNTEESAYHPLK